MRGSGGWLAFTGNASWGRGADLRADGDFVGHVSGSELFGQGCRGLSLRANSGSNHQV